MAGKYKRCKRYNDPGHCHGLTFTCFQRQPLLSRDRSRQWLVDSIARATKVHDCGVLAYVIMPEHVHLLLLPRRRAYHISRILSAIKLPVARRAVEYIRREAPWFLLRMADIQPNGEIHYRFWQRGGGYDRNLTEPKAIWAQIEYLHANPVRRGLGVRSEQWPWSSAADYAGLGAGPIPIDRECLPRDDCG